MEELELSVLAALEKAFMEPDPERGETEEQLRNEETEQLSELQSKSLQEFEAKLRNIRQRPLFRGRALLFLFQPGREGWLEEYICHSGFFPKELYDQVFTCLYQPRFEKMFQTFYQNCCPDSLKKELGTFMVEQGIRGALFYCAEKGYFVNDILTGIFSRKAYRDIQQLYIRRCIKRADRGDLSEREKTKLDLLIKLALLAD